MNVQEIINCRSSIRKYSDKPVPADLCRTLVEAGLKAPTAANKQEIHFTVVTADNPVQQEIQNDLNPDAENSFYYNAPLTIYLSAPEAFKKRQRSSISGSIAGEKIRLCPDAAAAAITAASVAPTLGMSR